MIYVAMSVFMDSDSIIPFYKVNSGWLMPSKKGSGLAEAIADAILIKALREVLVDPEKECVH